MRVRRARLLPGRGLGRPLGARFLSRSWRSIPTSDSGTVILSSGVMGSRVMIPATAWRHCSGALREELEKSFFIFGRSDPSSRMCALESADPAHERRRKALTHFLLVVRGRQDREDRVELGFIEKTRCVNQEAEIRRIVDTKALRQASNLGLLRKPPDV